MDVQRWIARQESQWYQLEFLLNQAERKGLRSFSATQLQQLSSLYRTVSSDLARARARQVGSAITEQLQSLTLRSYSQIYQGGRRQEWQAICEFFRWGFPAIVQKTWLYTAVAIGLFVSGGLISWWYAWRDPEYINLIVPTGIIHLVQDEGKLWMGSIIGIEPLASTQIMTNNISVTFATLAGGILAGLGTLFILWSNGLQIGAIAALVGQNHLAYPFWAFVLPHGSLELPAIFLSGGAGLLLAQGLVFPGRYKRLDALKLAGAQAIQIMFGVVPMLVIAGVIEGFFSPNPAIPSAIKYLMGGSLLWGLIVYLRRQRTQPS